MTTDPIVPPLAEGDEPGTVGYAVMCEGVTRSIISSVVTDRSVPEAWAATSNIKAQRHEGLINSHPATYRVVRIVEADAPVGDPVGDWSRLDESAAASAQMIQWHAPETFALIQRVAPVMGGEPLTVEEIAALMRDHRWIGGLKTCNCGWGPMNATVHKHRLHVAEAIAALSPRRTCIGSDPACPCADGDTCHYVASTDTPAWLRPEGGGS